MAKTAAKITAAKPLVHKAKGIVKKSHTTSPKPKAAPNTSATKVAVKTVRKVEHKAVAHKTVAHKAAAHNKSKLTKSVATTQHVSPHAVLVLVGQASDHLPCTAVDPIHPTPILTPPKLYHPTQVQRLQQRTLSVVDGRRHSLGQHPLSFSITPPVAATDGNVSPDESDDAVVVAPKQYARSNQGTEDEGLGGSTGLIRSFSDGKLENTFRSGGAVHHHHHHKGVGGTSPESESRRSKSFVPVPALFRSSLNIESNLEEMAGVFGVEKPRVPKMIKECGISPWAAVLAVGVGSSLAGSVAGSVAGSEAGESPTTSFSGEETDFGEGDVDLEAAIPRSSYLERRRGVSSRGGGEKTPVSVEDENMKRNFILKLSRTFFMYGAPSHRLEHHLTAVSKSLDVEAQFFILPNLVMISFGGEGYNSTTHFIKQTSSQNMSKLAQVNALCLTMTNRLIDIHNAVDLLDGIRAAKENPWWVSLLTFPVSSFCFALMMFQTSWIEATVAGGLGVIVGALSVFGGQNSIFGFMPELLGSTIAAFIASALQAPLHARGICFDYLPVTLASLVIFLPGMSLTIAIIELSTRNIVSGTVRMFAALFTAMLLGLGTAIGASLTLWEEENTVMACEPTSPLWAFLFFVPMAMAFNLLFQGSKHQWPIMTLASAVGYVTVTLLNMVPVLKAQPMAVNALASTMIGVTANVYARVTNDIAVGAILTSIYILVPGSLSVKSTLGFLTGTGSTNTTGLGAVADNLVSGLGFT
ncbi:hypothetical protein HDU98_009520 [Podochytrium sp. JEL0797]|nr:hypothetical protein HDU98_009520 [Podochytrium sp. JEL0797]